MVDQTPMNTPPDPKRGRHKKAASRETKRWESEHLIPPRPPWMTVPDYLRLVKMRNDRP